MAVNTTRENTNYANNGNSDEVFFSIMSHIGVLAEYQTGWKKEVNIVAWNGTPPKFDVRDWSPDHERMSRGITLHEEEARKLAEHLNRRFRGGVRMVHQPVATVAAETASVEEALAEEKIVEEAPAAVEPALEETVEENVCEEEDEEIEHTEEDEEIEHTEEDD